MGRGKGLIMAAAAGLVLASCDSGGSAVETRDRTASSEAPPPTSTSSMTPEAAPGEVQLAVTADRRESVDDKTRRLYERNGAAFGARSADDYLTKVRAFVENPPRDVETVKRPNGDTLFYQAATNTFAVTDRNGVARTMFKPDDGPAYWAQQKERAPTFGQRRASASN